MCTKFLKICRVYLFVDERNNTRTCLRGVSRGMSIGLIWLRIYAFCELLSIR
jgi:hypothetical protein